MDKQRILWDSIPYILMIITYFLTKKGKVTLRLPKVVRKLIENRDVMRLVSEAVRIAGAQSGKSEDEKRALARDAIRKGVQDVLGQWLPDSVVNLLIEKAITEKKAAG